MTVPADKVPVSDGADGWAWDDPPGGGSVSSVFTRSGAVVAAAGDYYGVVPAAATGATAASQYVGATASGAPASGAHVKGDFVVDQTGSFWVCTVSGTPGTWVQVVAGGGGPPTGSAGGTLGGTYPNPTVNTDGSTIETNSNALRVKAGGIGGTQLASTAVTPASYGDATHSGQFTVDQQGRITAAASVAISGAGGAGADGWVDDSAHTWTYASASTFTIAGVDLTSVFTKGTRLRFTQTTVKYGVVASSSFSTNTTVTIIVNTDHVLANAAISANSYSYAANPQGYPGWFNWTPTFVGFATAPTTYTAKFFVVGDACHVQFQNTNGTSGGASGTLFTITAPVAAATETTDMNFFGGVINNTTASSTLGIGAMNSGSSTIAFFRDFLATAWTNTGTKRFYCQPFFYRF